MEKEEIEALIDERLKPLLDEIEEMKSFLANKLDYKVIHISGEATERMLRMQRNYSRNENL